MRLNPYTFDSHGPILTKPLRQIRNYISIVWLSPPLFEFKQSVGSSDSEFSYYGANVYAYISAKYSDSIDIIMIQLVYMSLTRGHYSIKSASSTYRPLIISRATFIAEHSARGEQYFVHFGEDASVTLHAVSARYGTVCLSRNKVVLGLAKTAGQQAAASPFFISHQQSVGKSI